MLNDIVVQAQRLSAALPPDDWDMDAEQLGLIRQPSGVIHIVGLISRDDGGDRQLMYGATKPHNAPEDDVEDVGWMKRIYRTICRYLCGHQNEE